jgi:hypothetical protein
MPAKPRPLYLRLKNAVKTEANTIVILCDLDQAQMLHSVAKHFCLAAVPQIEKSIRLAEPKNRDASALQVGYSNGRISPGDG